MNVLEWTLARFTGRERATAILGDLLETAQTKGRVWFWAAFARVLARLAWRGPVAWVVGYGVGVALFEHFVTGDMASNSLNMSAGDPTTTIPILAACVVVSLSFPMWFIAPYGAVRFGLNDGMSRLAVPLCAVATLGLWLSQSQTVMMGCAVLITAMVVAALALGQWRPVVALGAVGCAGVGLANGLPGDGLGLLAYQYGWSYEVRWVLVRVACMVAFAMVTGVYTLMHRLLSSRLRTFLGTACVVAASGVALAYVPDSPAVFIAADVHASAYSATPEMRQSIHNDRLIVRDATMLNLISGAYGLNPKFVVGGPSWLEWDRYDVTAKIAPGIDPSNRRGMLQSLLAQRFNLATHSEDRPQPAFALTVKGKLKMKAGDASVPQKCESVPQPAAAGDAVPYVVVRCVSQTPEMLTKIFPQMAGGYVTAPVVDQTGLKGVWDLEIKWTARNMLTKAGADGISFFDALENQLGLQLAPTTSPLPVLVVDSVNEVPTPNAADLAKVMPPLPPAEFEVATIHLSKPDAEEDGGMNGLEINLKGVTLQSLIAFAWNVPDDGSTIVSAPKWLGVDKFDILAKAAVNGPPAGAPPEFDEDDLRQMLQTFLADRFKLTVHTTDQPMDAYNLVAVSPKMQKGDPTVRTGCKAGPGPDGKDPRIANPILNKLMTCQNITMAQFAQQLTTMAPGYVKTPVVDATGLAGGWNFTLSYSGMGKVKGNAAGSNAPAAAVDGQAAEPNGALSLLDALPRQTGLKLEKLRRPVQVLVIDHVDEKPTEN